MSDIVIIPTYQRPEYLQVCLELVQKADMAEELTYFFACDYGYDKRAKQIINKFPYQYGIIETPLTRFGTSKQSYNLLNAYLVAAKEADQFVFLIEDDIFIGNDFFNAHYQMQEINPFCSLGSKLHDKSFQLTGDKSTFRTTNTNVYHSHGVCFNKDIILKYIQPHFVEEYFTKPNIYIASHFPESNIGLSFTEQDGLIRRIHETTDLPIAYLDYPRSYHAGVWGYHRTELHPEFRRMNYDNKVKWIYDNCFSQERIAKYDKYQDINIVNLEVKEKLHYENP